MFDDDDMASLHHQWELDQQEQDEGYSKWARELEQERRREMADEVKDAMRDNKCSRSDYESDSE